jgi:outer membrane lipoprotein-sorting protein
MKRRPLAGLVLLAAAAAALGGDLDGRAIAEGFDKKNRPRDEVDHIRMVIIDRTGSQRSRELTIYFKAGEGDDDKTLVRFDGPPDMKGTGFLTLEEGEKDEQWLYLPELRKTKKIAGASKAQAFMGTDFSNYDMRTEDLAAHEYRRLADEALGGRDCYVIEAVPKSDEVAVETGYSKRKIWVDKERFTVPRVEFYDRSGKLLKVASADAPTQIEGLWRPTRVVMENVQQGSKTVVYHDRGREVNKGIDDGMFTRRALEKP